MADTLEGALTAAAESSEIIPGTTPTLTIKVSTDILKNTNNVRVDITQGSNIILTSPKAKIDKTAGTIVYEFTQDETYLMAPGTPINIQVHGIQADETAWKTKIFQIAVGQSLTKETIMLAEE